MLFNCLATRADHVDLSPDYSAEKFLMVLRRFVSLRGYPAQYRREGGGGGRRGNYPQARTQKGPGKNSVYEDISYIIIIITNLPLGPRKTLVS